MTNEKAVNKETVTITEQCEEVRMDLIDIGINKGIQQEISQGITQAKWLLLCKHKLVESD